MLMLIVFECLAEKKKTKAESSNYSPKNLNLLSVTGMFVSFSGLVWSRLYFYFVKTFEKELEFFQQSKCDLKAWF